MTTYPKGISQTMKMTLVERDDWISALLSDRYPKGTGALKTHHQKTGLDYYCCLGVLCEINVKRFDLRMSREEDSDEWTFSGAQGLLPRVMSEKYDSGSHGLNVPKSLLTEVEVQYLVDRRVEPSAYHDAEGNPQESYFLTVLNDQGFTFERITDFIKQLVEIVPK